MPQLDVPEKPATHTDLLTLFSDLERAYLENEGAEILTADNPLALLLGWQVVKNGKELFLGTIRLKSVKESLAAMPEEQAETIRTLFKSQAGREHILTLLKTQDGRRSLHA